MKKHLIICSLILLGVSAFSLNRIFTDKNLPETVLANVEALASGETVGKIPCRSEKWAYCEYEVEYEDGTTASKMDLDYYPIFN